MSARGELEARELHYAHPGPVPALAGCCLRARPGELLCVLGPNGAGKSTLLRNLAGLLVPDSGEVLLDGAPLAQLAARTRAQRVAYVPQALERVPELLVEDFVLGGRYAHLGPWRRRGPADRAIVARAMAAADTTELAQRPLTGLSGGQRQRVLIARALAQEAEVLLVDEPTASLDPAHQLGVMEWVATLAGEGRTVVVVTHDLNLASQFAARVLLMDQGRVVALGRPDDVLQPDVLCPVYGARLWFGELPSVAGEPARPCVLPWAGGGR